MIFIGIDPGVRACGVAAVDGDGELIGALWARTTTKKALAATVVEAAVAGARRFLTTRNYDGSGVVGIEMPRTYGGSARRGDTNDLLELSVVVGGLVQATPIHLFAHPVRVDVDTWKRNIDSAVLEARLLGHQWGDSLLSAKEQMRIEWPAKSYRHNVVDAIALARWLYDWQRKNPSKKLHNQVRL